jgi:hypothetical protein
MATNTYVALDTKTITSAVGSVTFTSINQTYKDLVIAISGNTSYNTSADAYQLSFNGATTGLSAVRLGGNGTSAYSDRHGTPYAGWISTAKGADLINIMNYANTTTYKTAVTRSASRGVYPQVGATAVLWANTNAITSVTITDTSGNWQVGSTFTLYGVAADTAITSTAKATGGTITYGVEHTYHVFNSGGTFTPSQNLTCDYVIVAGGGGGGNGGGGGGAGGYRSTYDFAPSALESQLALTSGVGYTVTIGSGGAGGVATRLRGGAGTSSSISGSGLTTITAAGGGSGAGFNDNTAANLAGGSGGGGANAVDSGQFSESGAASPSGQGNIGGRAWRTPGPSYNAFGGGGGAKTAGTDGSGSGSSPIAGIGGIGFQPTGVSVTLANGGLGGSESGTNAVGASGASNTGNGGGGGKGVDVNQNGGAGGSGIVIIRYAN